MEKKSNKTSIIIISIVLLVLIVLGCVLFIVLNKSGNKEIYVGDWECIKDVKLSMNNDKSFRMTYPNGDISGTYELKKTSDEGEEKSYTFNLKADKRVINGETITDSYTTQFEFRFDKNNKDDLVLMNTVSYSIYSCKRKG